MKVALLTTNDWGNWGYELSESLKSINIDATMYIKKVHPLGYPKHGVLVKDNISLNSMVKDADIIHFLHSRYIPEIDLRSKKVFVSHTGSNYRQDPEKLNKIFNPIVEACELPGSFLRLGAKNPYWIGGAVNLSNLTPKYDTNNKLVVGHFQSGEKGTSRIMSVTDKFKSRLDVRIPNEKLPWIENMDRVKDCDIYIEKLIGESNGTSALEAAALGDIVITKYIHKEQYEKHIGKLGIHIANSEKELENKLEWLLTLSKEEIIELKKESRKWIIDCHSYESVGKRYLNMYKGKR